ncbi:MAG: divergent polysaccharide deacetylase family protein [Elusimicrobiota bacterium]|jgi:hypothetical protein
MKAINILFSLILPLSTPTQAAQPPASSAAKPKIAVVLDDFGLNYKKTPPDAEWEALPFPLTFAVMPRSPKTREAARSIKASDKELIIHFPFDPFLKLELPKDAVSEKDAAVVEALLAESFRDIPGPAGINTHRSLKATQNRPLMARFMKGYKAKGLYFLDSGVSPKTVAYAEARAAGIPAVRNDLFLEPTAHPGVEQCRKVLLMAERLARKRGHATVIGHHYHRSTLDCLKGAVPELQKQGIEFVFASQLATPVPAGGK